MSRLPDFLIIGAMKSGTTTLFHDLATHPRVFFPIHKELGFSINLTQPKILTDQGRAEYAQFFVKAEDDQLVGEASTVYTKRPTFEDTPKRALELLGPNIKLLYIIREPIKRLISHYHHELFREVISDPIEEELPRHPEMVQYSRYAMQLEPWIETFGREALKVIRFEDYVADRVAGCAAALEHLGLDPGKLSLDIETAHNQTQGKPLSKGWVFRLSKTPVYEKFVRPMISMHTRKKLQNLLLPKAKKPETSLSQATIDRLVKELGDDQQRLRVMLGLEAPLWDLPKIYSKDKNKPNVA